jgi:hypothetical protein
MSWDPLLSGWGITWNAVADSRSVVVFSAVPGKVWRGSGAADDGDSAIATSLAGGAKAIIRLPERLHTLGWEKVMIRALVCKLNLRHEWHGEHTDDGSLYRGCLRCGKDDNRGSGRIGNFGGSAGFIA